MSKSLAKPPPPSRYSYAAAALEVARKLATRERGEQKAVAAHLNLTEPQFSHRLRGINARFTIEHFGAMADFWEAPPGWPFIPEHQAPAKPAGKPKLGRR